METTTGKKVRMQGKSRHSVKSSNRQVPWLTVSGVWLEKSGFNIGDVLRITRREKLLIIEVEEEGKRGGESKRCINEMRRLLQKIENR